MKNFFLIANTAKDPDFKVSNEIVSYIMKKGGTAMVMEHMSVTTDDIPKATECIFVLGGDGTLIRLATKLYSLEIPLIGVNLGTLGYLCELEEHSIFPAIDQLMIDDYLIEKRMMLSNQLSDQKALNDVVISSKGEQRFIHLTVYVNGTRLNTYHADGIIVSTPTGSTGYNLSAGGPIVSPKAKMILLTPINDHHLGAKSICLDPDDVIEVELNSRRVECDEEATVYFDGDLKDTLKVGDRFEIRKAEEVAKICRLSKLSFLENLRKKMEQ